MRPADAPLRAEVSRRRRRTRGRVRVVQFDKCDDIFSCRNPIRPLISSKCKRALGIASSVKLRSLEMRVGVQMLNIGQDDEEFRSLLRRLPVDRDSSRKTSNGLPLKFRTFLELFVQRLSGRLLAPTSARAAAIATAIATGARNRAAEPAAGALIFERIGFRAPDVVDFRMKISPSEQGPAPFAGEEVKKAARTQRNGHKETATKQRPQSNGGHEETNVPPGS